MTDNLKNPVAQKLVDAIFVTKGVMPLVRERQGNQIHTTLIMGFGGPGKNNTAKITCGLENKCQLLRWAPVIEDENVAGWLKIKSYNLLNHQLTDEERIEITEFLSEDYHEAPDKFNAIIGTQEPTSPTTAVATVVDKVQDNKDGTVLVYADAGEPIVLKGFAARRIRQESNPKGKIIVRHASGVFRLLKSSKFLSFYNTVEH